MDVRDFGNRGPGDGLPSGLGISFLAHLALVVVVFLVPWTPPPKDATLSYCSVSLLAGPGAGNGSPQGAEGSAGGGTIEPAPSAETVPTPPEPDEIHALPAHDSDPDAVPLAPVPKAVRKPAQKRKPKVERKAPETPSRAESRIARTDASPPATFGAAEESKGAPGSLRGEKAEGSGPGTGEGSGKGNAEDGPGAGSGSGSGAGGGPFDVSFGSGDGPRFDRKTLPNYPRLARELGKEGIVLLRVTIDERGRLVDVEVVKGAGSGFDEEALKAVRNSTFCPAKRNGSPVPCRARLPIRFILTRTR